MHRFMQQLTMVQQFNAFRMAHRIAVDETFGEANSLPLRMRYRIGAEFPLNGLFVDSNEFYFKVNHEYLNKFSESDYDLGLCFVPALGYLITNTNKVEIAFDYRVNSFIDGDSANNF